jgi:flagellum-specific peptidoglycan hydrolase FlgJ
LATATKTTTKLNIEIIVKKLFYSDIYIYLCGSKEKLKILYMHSIIRKTLVVICGLLFVNFNIFAGTNEQKKFISENLSLAVESCRNTGIPVSIKLAQAILESESGTSKVVKRTSNYFGLRKRRKNGSYYYVSFRNKRESFMEHSKRLKDKRYKRCFKNKRYDDFAYSLRDCGYCPEKDYPKKVIRIIERYNLDKYDFLTTKKTAEKLTFGGR